MPLQGSPPDAEWKRCPDCGSAIPGWQKRHRARACPGYSELWAGDVRVKIFSALRAYVECVPPQVEPQVRMLTVTAPGTEAGLIWDEEKCRHLGPHRHSGKLGCRVAAAPAAAWNERAPVWWRSLHHEASQATLRRTGARPRLLVRPWELQRRGMLHVHPVVGCSTARERTSAEVYTQELARRASRHGFGFVDRKEQLRNPVAAAAYLSSYFVAGRKGRFGEKGKLTLRESVTTGTMPPSIVYVQPELSQRSGVTMRSLRLKRYLYALAGSAWMWLHTEQGLSLEDLVRAHGAGLTFLQVAIGNHRAQGP